jgi:hypothetical protein
MTENTTESFGPNVASRGPLRKLSELGVFEPL